MESTSSLILPDTRSQQHRGPPCAIHRHSKLANHSSTFEFTRFLVTLLVDFVKLFLSPQAKSQQPCSTLNSSSNLEKERLELYGMYSPLARATDADQHRVASTVGLSGFKKLNKNQINKVDIQEACEQIMNPPEPMALRLSSTLMTGVTRVYASQVTFYHTDVNQACIKLRKSFLTNSTDNINMTHSEAKRDAITLEAVLDGNLLDFGAEPQVELNRLLVAAKARQPGQLHDMREVQMGWINEGAFDMGTSPLARNWMAIGKWLTGLDTPERPLARQALTHSHSFAGFVYPESSSTGVMSGVRPFEFDMSRAPSSIGFHHEQGGELLFDDFDLVPGSVQSAQPSPHQLEEHVAPNVDMVGDPQSEQSSIHDTPDKPKRKSKPRKKKAVANKVDERTFVPFQTLFLHHQAQQADGVDRSILPATYFTDMHGQVPISWFPFPQALPPVIANGLITGFEYGEAEKQLREKWRQEVEKREVMQALISIGPMMNVPEYEAIWHQSYTRSNKDRFDELFDKKRKGNSPEAPKAKRVRKTKSANHSFHGNQADFQLVFQDNVQQDQLSVIQEVDSVELGRHVVEASPAPWQNYIDKSRPASESRSMEKNRSKQDPSPVAWGDAPWSASAGGSFGMPTREGSFAFGEPQLPVSDSLMTDGPGSVPFHLKDQVALAHAQELEKETQAFLDYMRDVTEQAGMETTVFSDLVPKGTGRDQVANAFAYGTHIIVASNCG